MGHLHFVEPAALSPGQHRSVPTAKPSRSHEGSQSAQEYGRVPTNSQKSAVRSHLQTFHKITHSEEYKY